MTNFDRFHQGVILRNVFKIPLPNLNHAIDNVFVVQLFRSYLVSTHDLELVQLEYVKILCFCNVWKKNNVCRKTDKHLLGGKGTLILRVKIALSNMLDGRC